MNQIQNMKGIVEACMKVLGWGIHTLNLNYEPEDNPDHVHNVQLVTTHGTYNFDARYEMRIFTTTSLLGERHVPRGEWVLTTIVQKDGGYWDPPYEDEVELASDPSLAKAFIDALLSEVRVQMYDALPYIPDNTVLDIEEDIPQ